MWSHIWGWSHLAVQRANQLVKSGSEWTIKTLEATERKAFLLAILLTTVEGNFFVNSWSVIILRVTRELRNTATKLHQTASTCNFKPSNLCKILTGHNEGACH